MRLKRLQRALSRKVRGSNNYYKNKRPIAIQHEKISNQRKDFLHKRSKELINKNQVINIESLKNQKHD
ncbi:MAG: transposase [Dethiosulfatibacter sp.]|nr:transposase [Dethiosulfatibacter sp.]